MCIEMGEKFDEIKLENIIGFNIWEVIFNVFFCE